jgi:O-antigen/teichoic acid export membrane protein
MLLASGLGFLKLIALAYAITSHDYGQYVTYIGISAYSCMILSFGLVEKTIKNYPRQWVSGEKQIIISDALGIVGNLILRFLLVGIAGISLSIYRLIPITTFTLILTTILGLCTVLLAVVGSLYRAAGSLKALQNFTLLRSAMALVLVLTLGTILGWQAAIAGDIISSIAGICYAIWHLSKLYKKTIVTQTIKDKSYSTQKNGSYQIYFSNLAVAPQSMIDKGWVSATVGSSLAGSYGVVMLIPQAVQLLGNVIVQHIGPLIIKHVHLKNYSENHRNSIKSNASVLSIFSIILTFTALIAKRTPYLDHIFEKYIISDISIVLAGVIACSQVYSVIEFHLIARDRETNVLFASIISCLIFLITFAVAGATHANIEFFLASAALARWCQVLLLGRAYLQYK